WSASWPGCAGKLEIRNPLQRAKRGQAFQSETSPKPQMLKTRETDAVLDFLHLRIVSGFEFRISGFLDSKLRFKSARIGADVYCTLQWPQVIHPCGNRA